MNKIKQILSIILCVTLLSGCGDQIKLNHPKKSSLPPVNLNFCWIGSETPAAKAVLKEVAEKSNLNITINIKWITLDYNQNLEDELSDPAYPIDAFIIGGNVDYPELTYSTLGKNGELLDLTKLLPSVAPNIYKNFSKEDIDSLKVDGKLYVIPSLKLPASIVGVTVRKDLMKKYNMSAINNLDDLEAYFAKVKELDSNITPLTYNAEDDTEFYARLYGYVCLNNYTNLVYKYDDPKMKLIPWEATAAYKDLGDRLRSWYQKGYMSDTPDGKTDVAAIFGSSQYLEGNCIMPSSTSSSGFEGYTYRLDKDMPILKSSPITSMLDNGGIAISINSKNANRTLKFLNWVQANKDNYNLMVYGRVGKDYTLTKGIISLPPLSVGKDPYYDWNSSPFRNFSYDLSDFYTSDSLKGIKAAANSMVSKAVYVPHNGFVPNYSVIENTALIKDDLLGADSAKKNEVIGAIQSQLDAFMKSSK